LSEIDGDVALIISFDSNNSSTCIEAYTPIPSDDPSTLSRLYLSACDLPDLSSSSPIPCNISDISPLQQSHLRPQQKSHKITPKQFHPFTDIFLSAKKKYKPVAKKVRPIIGELPEKFRIQRKIIGDPLADLPVLNPLPPPFVPTNRYTLERRNQLDKSHPEGFLWPEERAFMHEFVRVHEDGFAWEDSERGSFRTDFFPPVDFPVIPHTPWVDRNFPIPPGIFDEVCALVRKKIAAGVYEPSNSSYRSRWFCVLKKGGTNLRPVHSLEPLNRVTIQHSGVPPIPEYLAEQFGGRACGGMLDLYVGYDERLIAESSRDYTTFQTPFGALRLVTLPMGWTNSVPIFHDDVTFILQDEIPHYTVPYIDDVPVKGPKSRYMLADGSYETIAENPGIRRFVWEHFQSLNRIVQRMKYCGGTFSGPKLFLCVTEIFVLGHRCTFEGRMPDESRVAAIRKWGPCSNLSEVRAFLGTVGVVRIFIRNFSLRAHHLIKLTRKDAPFEFGPLQLAAQEDLKDALLTSPALRAIDYTSSAPVILAVDTSYIAVGFHLCQCDIDNPRKRYFSRFCSITLNDRESRYSQPKLEIYGLYRALRSLRIYLIGLRNLIVEVDAKYIKGMLANPDISPSASINRWIVAILTFHFELVHVAGSHHGPDGLSRRPRQPDDEDPIDDEEEFEDWIDKLHGFMHQINSTSTSPYPTISTFAVAQDLSEEDPSPIPYSYDSIPRSAQAKADEDRLLKVRKWLQDLVRPIGLSDAEYSTFMRYCTEFFVDHDQLWRKSSQGAHKLIPSPNRRFDILRTCHDEIGHKAFFATKSHIAQRFWWPGFIADIQWYTKTCHLCQIRQLRQVLIPPTVATPAPIFAKAYIDTMHMPPSGSFRFIVQARCSLTYYPEFRMLRSETAKTLGDWIFEDILCRWGSLREIVSDNGPAFLKALAYLSKRYKITHIRISGYNSRANGMVERSHFDVRQSLFKAVDGDQKRWSIGCYSVFWAERITTRKRMGCSPYFAVTGAHPLLPLDISESTYLLPAPTSILSSTDLIARRAIALQKRSEDINRLYSKVFEARLQAAIRFEKLHARTLRDFDFTRGDLVLMRNTQIEKSLNRKMRPRYIGPLIVISRNFGGAYILSELDGSVLHRPIAAFRVIPYFARQSIPIPDHFIDIPTARLRELEETTDIDGEEDEERTKIVVEEIAEDDA